MKRSMSTAGRTLVPRCARPAALHLPRRHYRARMASPMTSPAAPAAPSAWSSGVAPIVTPEAVVLDFDRAGVASRALAFSLDLFLLVLTLTLLLVGAAAAGLMPDSD